MRTLIADQMKNDLQAIKSDNKLDLLHLLRSIPATSLPLKNQQSLSMLSWLHSIIFAVIMVALGVGPNTRLVEWLFPLTFANVIMLLLFTMPLSRYSPSFPFKKLWAVGLGLIYLILSCMLGGIRQFSLSGYEARMMYLSLAGHPQIYAWQIPILPYLVALGLICSIAAVVGICHPIRLDKNVVTAWLLLSLSSVASVWNVQTSNIPLYLLLGFSTYYFIATSGIPAFRRLIVASVCALLWPCYHVLLDYWGQFTKSGRDLIHFLDFHGRMPGIEHWLTATFLTPMPPIALAAALAVRHKWARRALLAITAIVILAAITPMERSAWLSLFIMGMLGILVISARWRVPRFVISLSVLAIVISLILGIRVFWQKPESDVAHLALLKPALWAVQQWPWLGTGVGHYNIASRIFLDTHRASLSAQESVWIKTVDIPHSAYLQLLVETGIIGTLVVIVGGAQLLLYLRNIYRGLENRDTRILMLGILIGFIGFCGGIAVFLADFSHTQFSGPFAIFLGAVLGLGACRREEPIKEDLVA
jgi:hypothetical protein